MPNFQRDILMSGGTNDYFVAPEERDYWLYNPPTNVAITISKAGKAPQIIASGEVFVIHLGKGEELAISGTAGNILAISDHADVKLIPSGKDILGVVELADANGTKYTLTNPIIVQGRVANANPTLYDAIIAGANQVSATGTADIIIGGQDSGLTPHIIQTDTSGLLNVNVQNTPKLQVGIGTGNSVAVGGSATAPTAGTIIATVTPGVQQSYNVWCWASVDLGVPVAADLANMKLFKTAVAQTILPYTTQTGGPFGPFRITVLATDTLNIKATGNATANVVYVAGIVAIPVP